MQKFTVNDFLEGINSLTRSSLTTQDILLCLLITFLTALFIFLVYRKTYAGVLYSREFNVTLIIVSMVVAVIMLGISRNLALSLGMIGALSIVRFRSAIKDPKDITFLFWSISVGIVNGVQLYKLSIISSIVIGLLLIVLCKKLALSPPFMLILKFEERTENATFDRILNRYCKKHKVRNMLSTDDGNEVTIELKMKRGKENELMKELKQIKGVSRVNMFSFTGQLGD